MLLRPAFVLMLLQLHASSTSTDSEREQSVSTQKIKRIHPTVGAVQRRKTSHEPLSSIPLQDEDLLDLMVRIAQSPSEWERIQQVLSQLGKPENLQTKEKTQNTTHLMKDNSNNVDVVQGYPNSQISTVTSYPLNTLDVDYKDKTAHARSQIKVTKDIDSGWPDFEEAILKKVKKPQRKSEPILQKGLFGNDWFDTSWNAFTGEEKDEKPLSQNWNVEPPAVSFVKLNITEGSSVKGSNSLGKSTNDARNTLDLSTRDDVPNHSEDYAENLSNRISRPVFMYHRVTTSPQERKSNNAIIAVSVARREHEAPASAPSNMQFTPRIQAIIEDNVKSSFERHRNKERTLLLDKPVSSEHLRHHTHSHH